ncbi:sulfite exporter TauE/SafE family protein [Agromyces seonyuensis]|uniref:Probable membrane transporter protein n=1 Tax=Agromyces seonyuensis TaxID=2662446 RepID=A0A6I4NSQ1_9MICO|nr:sulfite exporter TauE/SafE family protein [Agromyces seonyuensis]MWB97151.1 TSUP family transporter [Agromyces seonyuensis]
MTSLLAGAVVVLATIVQRLTGMGFGVVAVPLLALVAPAYGIFSVLVLTIAVMAIAAWVERDALDARSLAIASAASLPGIALGTVLASRLPLAATHFAIGAIVIAGSAASLAGWRIAPGRPSLVAGAVAAGVLTPIAALPGPPMALVYRPEDVRRMRATLSAFFAVGSIVAAVTALAAGVADPVAESGRAAVLVPAILLGVILAVPLVRRLHRRVVQSAALLLSLCSGAALLIRAIAESAT